MKVQIKPLSVNRAWRSGPRYKTKEYLAYEQELAYKLPKLAVPEGNLHVTLVVGLSNKASDIDNIAKPFIDCLQKQYGFNDKRIYRLILEKKDCEKGEEFIDFSISSCS